MGRSFICPRTGLKRGAWTAEEDRLLSVYITRYGNWNWREIPKFAGLSRCGKSCRLRWMNYLRPSIKRGNYTIEEDQLIVKLHHELGNKWSAIAASLPGRTDNEIKNYWFTCLNKGIKNGMNSKEPKGKPYLERESLRKMERAPYCADPNLIKALILESSTVLSPLQTSAFSSTASNSEALIVDNQATKEEETKATSDSVFEFDEHFWTRPFMVNDSRPPGRILSDTVLEFDENFWTQPFLIEDSYTPDTTTFNESEISSAVMIFDESFWSGIVS